MPDHPDPEHRGDTEEYGTGWSTAYEMDPDRRMRASELAGQSIAFQLGYRIGEADLEESVYAAATRGY